MRRFAAVVAAAAALAAAGCGDDGGDGAEARGQAQQDRQEEQEEQVADTAAELTATVRREGRKVVVEYVLVNEGDEPLGVVDVATVMDRLEPLDGGAYRVSYLRASADPAAGSPLPDLQGTLLPAGGTVTGTARVTGEFDQVPPAVQLCIEVVADDVEGSAGGTASFPYRHPDTPPTLACTGRLPVPE